MTASHICFASWRWMSAAGVGAFLTLVVLFGTSGGFGSSAALSSPTSAPAPVNVSPSLSSLAHRRPTQRIEAVVQMAPNSELALGHELVEMAGGHVTRDLTLIHGFSATMTAASAERLALYPSVWAVSISADARPSRTSFEK